MAKKSRISDVTIAGTPGDDDPLHGTAGDDVVAGLAGDDRILAAAGNDRLYGGLGSDVLDGGDNDAVPDYRALAGDDPEGRGDHAVFADLPHAVSASLLVGEARELDRKGLSVPDGETDVLVGIEGLVGTALDDRLEGDGLANRLEGGRGDDVIHGLEGNDLLVGDSPGSGKGGDDLLEGGEGDDVLFGSGGRDTLDGGPGNDLAAYDDARGIVADLVDQRVVEGRKLVDTLIAIEEIRGSRGNDRIFGDAGDNTLAGLDRHDRIDGRDGDDALDGGAGKDVLEGGGGDDRLEGGEGKDVLAGGDGDDVLAGGDGKDVFAFAYRTDDPLEGLDVVLDFAPKSDKLHLDLDGFLGDPAGKALFAMLDTNANRILDDADNHVRVEEVASGEESRPSTILEIGLFLGVSEETLTLFDAVDLTARNFA